MKTPAFCYDVGMIELFGTLGPSCGGEAVLTELFQNGMNGMRLNLSHASLSESRTMIEHFHAAADSVHKEAVLLIDLIGPELRIGVLGKPLELKTNELFSPQELAMDESLCGYLKDGDEVLFDDGRILCLYDQGKLCVKRGGILTSRKSIKVVGRDIPMPPLTEMDYRNISNVKEYGVKAVMQPFVRSAQDLQAVRRALDEAGAEDIRIFAKIENRQGLSHLEEIIDYSDMIVIARGDLGNDVPLPRLPGVQKDIAKACIRKQVPFLVVTQMLTSMLHNPVPTRAEVSDIFNAVTDGASALMVTNETAAGDYPAEVMKVLYETASAAEEWLSR